MEGSIQELSVSDLLQILMSASKTGTLRLRYADQQGVVYLKDGEAVHAQYENLAGEEALQDMVLWSEGSFSFTTKFDTPRHTITSKNTNSILINTNKIQDDLKESIGKYRKISFNSLVYAIGNAPPDLSDIAKSILDMAKQPVSMTNILKLTKGETEPIITLFNQELLNLVDPAATKKYNLFMSECNNSLETISSRLSLGNIGEFERDLNELLKKENIPLTLKNFRLYWDTNSMDEDILKRSFSAYYGLFLSEVAKYDKLISYLNDFQRKMSLFI